MHAFSERIPQFGRSFRIRLLLATLILLALAMFSFAAMPDATERERLADVRIPFVGNCGQWDERVAFAAKSEFGTAFVTQDGQIVYSSVNGASDSWTLTETAISEKKPSPRPGQAAVTRVSYFHGNDPRRWHTGLRSYEEISLGDVWPGISVSLRARGATVEKIFTVQPDSGTEKIRLRVNGARSLRIDSDGSLVADTGSGDIRFTAPAAYQEQGSVRHPVTAAYVLHGSRYGFRLGDYDSSLPLIIDPILQSTYLGGSLPEVTGGGEYVTGIAINPTSGEVFVTGWTSSTDFPGTTGGAQPANAGGEYPYEVFVARLDATLTTLLQATYLGGSSLEGGPPGTSNFGIAINPTSGEVFVTGRTSSTDFPGTAGGFQAVPGDSFIARLDPTLTTLLQATYLGDSSVAYAIAVHPTSGEVLVTGSTGSHFLDTTGGAQPVYGGLGDAFVARLNSSLTTLLQATYLGGSYGEKASCIAVDPASGEVLVSGSTTSTDFPGTVGGAQPGSGGDSDGFVARFNPSLTTLIQATYLGGSGSDGISGFAIHPTTHEVLVTGETVSPDFPGTAGGAQSNPGGGDDDAFVARLDPTLTTLLQATYLGGSTWESAGGIVIHPATGQVFVTGTTESTDFPGTAGGAQPIGGSPCILGHCFSDGFVTRLNPALTTLLQSTYLGGRSYDYSSEIAIHPGSGEVFVAGYTFSYDLPGAAGGAQPVYSGGGNPDGFVARLTPDLRAVPGPPGGPRGEPILAAPSSRTPRVTTPRPGEP
jgi:hypothetical protein